MKNRNLFLLTLFATLGLFFTAGTSCSGGKKTTGDQRSEVIVTNAGGQGIALTIDFVKGKSHNHPLMVIWTEDMDGKYIETLYVAESIGKGIFRHGERSRGQWMPGPVRRPAALPYWGHKRGFQAEDGYYIPTPESPMPDAITGPTPAGDFMLKTRSTDEVPSKFRLMLEINQSWDWNEFWTNNKYPDDIHYSTSSQPAIVYEAAIDLDSDSKTWSMKPVGHSHYSGLDGSLDPDLGTLTTALEIVRSVTVSAIP